MSTTAADHAWMAQALQLAARGLHTAHPNPRVGCVIVADGQLVGAGWHARTGGPHAEAMALAAAGARAAGATAYVTLEPCCHQGRTPPCTDALRAAGISRVVFGAADPDPRVAGGGARALNAAGVQVVGGVLEAESRELNIGFMTRHEQGRPWVRLKVAASLDGRMALADGASRWITADAARADGHAQRARSSAILTGIGTVLADDPALTVRLPGWDASSQPLRVVADSRLALPPGARLLRQPGANLVVAAEDDAARRAALETAGASVAILPGAGGRPDLAALMAALAGRGVNELLVEAGPRLNGALLDARLVDELLLYLAPHVLGADAIGMFAGRALHELAARHEFDWVEERRVGTDLRLTLRRRRS